MEQVTVSKIFPAGAGWQAASIVADAAGHQADSLAFAAYTGVGDGIAVAAGPHELLCGEEGHRGPEH